MNVTTENMKMYHFSEGGYAEEFHLIAHNKEETLEYLKAYFTQMKSSDVYYDRMYQVYDQNCDFMYEYDVEQVVQTEVS